tara:strand:+ start:60 stop:239 length:180 start_codon:yes stop_codon:yes gene_type:complete
MKKEKWIGESVFRSSLPLMTQFQGAEANSIIHGTQELSADQITVNNEILRGGRKKRKKT